jgi:DNA mismatch repair ATPase MutL
MDSGISLSQPEVVPISLDEISRTEPNHKISTATDIEEKPQILDLADNPITEKPTSLKMLDLNQFKKETVKPLATTTSRYNQLFGPSHNKPDKTPNQPNLFSFGISQQKQPKFSSESSIKKFPIQSDVKYIDSILNQKETLKITSASMAQKFEQYHLNQKLKQQSTSNRLFGDFRDELCMRTQVQQEDFEKMKVIGQFNLGFIIVLLDGKELFIVDQHAR